MGATDIYYRLPINLEFIAIAMRDESPDTVFFIDLLTGGIFSLQRPEDGNWEQAGNGYDHDIQCGFSHTPERFVAIDALSVGEKQQIISAFAATLADQVLVGQLCQATHTRKPFTAVVYELRDHQAELCAWRAHMEQACTATAAEFLQEREIGIVPAL